MPLDKVFIEDLKKSLTIAKQKRLNFGLCLGKKPEATVLVLDKLKAPEVLGRSAKKDGETPLVTWGELGVDGNKICLYCQGDIVSGLQKKLKAYLQAAGLAYKILIMDANGAMLEGEAEGDSATADPLVAEWEATKLKYAKLVEQARALPGGQDIYADWQACVGLADSGDLRAALTAAEGIELKIVEARRNAQSVEDDANRWSAASAKIAPMLKEFEGSSLDSAKKLLAAWNFAKTKASSTPPDYATAIKSLSVIVKLIEAARAEAKTDLEMEPEPVSGGGKGDLLSAGTGAKSGAKVGQQPGAQTSSPGGTSTGTPPPQTAQPQTTGPESSAKTTSDAPEEVSAKGDGPPKPTAEAKEKLAFAEAQLTALDKKIADYLAVAIPGVAATAPQVWVEARKGIDKVIQPMRAPNAVIDDQKISDLPKSIERVVAAINRAAAEKATFLKAYGLVELALVPIDRHPMAAEPAVATAVAPIKTAMGRACQAAAIHDFRTAGATLGPLSKLCDDVVVLQDQIRHYKSIEPLRQTMVTAMTVVSDKEIDKLAAAATKLKQDATASSTGGKYGDAIKALDKIPALSDEYRRLVKFKDEYDFVYPLVGQWMTAAKAYPAEVQKLLKPTLDKVYAQIAASEIKKTASYAKSNDILSNLYSNMICPPGFTGDKFVEVEVKAVTAYTTAKAAFDPKFEMFKKHKGLDGIRPFFDQLDRERVQADSEAKSLKWGTAAAILGRSASQWAAQQALADEAVTYLDKRKALDTLIADTRKLKGVDELMAQVDSVLASATRQFAAQDFAAAKTTLDEAKTRCETAKKAADAKAEFDKAKVDKSLRQPDKAFVLAEAAYGKLRETVSSKDAGGVLAPKLAEADVDMQAAKAELAKPAADAAAAKASLDKAIKALEALMPKAVAAGPFATHLAAAKVQHAALTDPDAKLTPQIQAVNALIAEAEALGKAPDFDFAAAESKLVEAGDKARKAVADAALWPQIKADREVLDNVKNQFLGSPPPVPTLMKASLDKLTKWQTEIDEYVAAQDFKAASKHAKEARAATLKHGEEWQSATLLAGEFDSRYTQKLPLLYGANQIRADSQVKLVEKLKGQYDEAVKAANYEAARNLTLPMAWALHAGKRILDEYALYEADRLLTEGRLTVLRGLRNAGIEADVQTIETEYAAGVALSAKETNLPAQKVMLGLRPRIEALITKAPLWKAYDDALKAADTKLDALSAHDQAAAIEPMLKALRGQREAGAAAGGKEDFAGAKTILDKLVTAADAAKGTADAAKAVTDKADAIEGGAVDPTLLAEAKALFDGLNGRADADNARAELDLAKDNLDKATAEPEASKAAPLLKAAMQECTKAQIRLSQTEVIEEGLKAVEALVAGLKSHGQSAYLAKDSADLDAAIKAMRDGVKTSGPDAEGGKIKGLNETCGTLRLLADAQAKYVALRATPELEPRLKVLEEHQHRYSVKPSIDSFRKLLDEAAAKSAERDPEAAIKLLEKGSAIAAGALMMAEMRNNVEPTPEAVRKVLEGPGGSDELDAMIDQLEPESMRKVLKVAFEARFGCKLDVFADKDASGPINPITDGNLSGPDIKRFYQIMSKLPKDHVVDNDSMRLFTVVESRGASSYGSSNKRVIMREGEDALSGAYGFGRDHEVGGADDNCKPANTKEVKFFTWNTLHEVGHAVDDKLHFMDQKGKDADKGGWIAHGRDTQAIGAAVAGHFGYDPTYVGQLLAGMANPAPPPKPKDQTCSDEEWEKRRLQVEAWRKGTLTGNDPWIANETATKIAIGGRVYQESYANNWTSYDLSARKRGITGYQFRAPGEWFAEMYAAYHSDKLKPQHPAVSWLSTL